MWSSIGDPNLRITALMAIIETVVAGILIISSLNWYQWFKLDTKEKRAKAVLGQKLVILSFVFEFINAFLTVHQLKPVYDAAGIPIGPVYVTTVVTMVLVFLAEFYWLRIAQKFHSLA